MYVDASNASACGHNVMGKIAMRDDLGPPRSHRVRQRRAWRVADPDEGVGLDWGIH